MLQVTDVSFFFIIFLIQIKTLNVAFNYYETVDHLAFMIGCVIVSDTICIF